MRFPFPTSRRCRVVIAAAFVALLAERYDLRPGSACLLRPDQHVCARWRQPTAALVQAALRRALGCAERTS